MTITKTLIGHVNICALRLGIYVSVCQVFGRIYTCSVLTTVCGG